ncbi:MAG: hypothetical protein COA79_15440 [Planctomycetota bacterium]|nr:MAG: hypothetical protein COA79_15440 [Planctomycetota bacterium]
MPTKSFSRLLIVEDDKESLGFLKDVFTNEFITEVAEDGMEAKSILKDFSPDIIIADIRMPKLNGYELTAWVKQNETLRNTKVLLLSGLKNTKDRLAGYKVGADDYIIKPFDTEELKTKINILLKLKKTEDELSHLVTNLEKQVKLKTSQLIKSEKFAIIGRNAAGFIHNMNNPICNIKGIGDLLKKKYKDESLIETLTDSTKQLQEIIYSILRKADSKKSNKAKLVRINHLLENEVKMHKLSKFGQVVEFNEIYETNREFKCYPGDLSQVFSNLISNAIQSMYKSKQKILTIKTNFENHNIIVEFFDTGCGMDKKTKNKIFDPFFTTKTCDPSNSKEPIGTGLGMPTCKTMLESYNGKITVDSKLNIGTMVRLFLPIQD